MLGFFSPIKKNISTLKCTGSTHTTLQRSVLFDLYRFQYCIIRTSHRRSTFLRFQTMSFIQNNYTLLFLSNNGVWCTCIDIIFFIGRITSSRNNIIYVFAWVIFAVINFTYYNNNDNITHDRRHNEHVYCDRRWCPTRSRRLSKMYVVV